MNKFVELGAVVFERNALRLELLARLVVFVSGALGFALELIELVLALFDAAFLGLNTLKPLLGLTFGFSFDTKFFFACLKEFFLFYDFGIALGFRKNCVGS